MRPKNSYVHCKNAGENRAVDWDLFFENAHESKFLQRRKVLVVIVFILLLSYLT